MSIFLRKDLAQSFTDVSTDKRIVEGYFASFNNLDSDGDIIRPGAFAKSITENGPAAKQRIKHIMNHDIRMPVGTLLDLKEDNHGLFYRSQIGTNRAALDFLEMVKSSMIKEHSIGYWTIRKNQIKEGNELLEVLLMEGSSLTGWGASSLTPLTALKSADKPAIEAKLKERLKDLEKFIKNTTVSDETVELLMIEVKQLSQYILDLSTQAAEEAPAPESKVSETEAAGILLKLHSLSNSYI